MANHHVIPHESHPQPFPKAELYEAIAALNRDLGSVIDDLNRLREFRFSRKHIDAFIAKAELLRAEANAELLERQRRREEEDEGRFWTIATRFESRYRDPDDILLEARDRLKQLAVEENDALEKARTLRKRRRLAEKRLSEAKT